MANPVLARGFTSPQTDSQVSSAPPMTVAGVSRATLTLLALFLPAAVFGWSQVEVGRFPSWMLGALILGLVAVVAGSFLPKWAPFIGPVYAVVEGALVGAISKVYESLYSGLVTQAILATGLTVLVMAVLYATRTIRVTERLRSIVVGATVAVFLFYLVSFGLSFFGIQAPLIWDAGNFGIGFSLVVIALAAFNLLLDFDLIERGVKTGAPAYMNWYAAFGLLVTVVWLYLEILRLLGKLNRR